MTAIGNATHPPSLPRNDVARGTFVCLCCANLSSSYLWHFLRRSRHVYEFAFTHCQSIKINMQVYSVIAIRTRASVNKTISTGFASAHCASWLRKRSAISPDDDDVDCLRAPGCNLVNCTGRKCAHLWLLRGEGCKQASPLTHKRTNAHIYLMLCDLCSVWHLFYK